MLLAACMVLSRHGAGWGVCKLSGWQAHLGLRLSRQEDSWEATNMLGEMWEWVKWQLSYKIHASKLYHARSTHSTSLFSGDVSSILAVGHLQIHLFANVPITHESKTLVYWWFFLLQWQKNLNIFGGKTQSTELMTFFLFPRLLWNNKWLWSAVNVTKNPSNY